MFFWRKKAEGFDWHKYVRTTIKLRREQRREKIEDIGRVAVKQAKGAGNAAANGRHVRIPAVESLPAGALAPQSQSGDVDFAGRPAVRMGACRGP